MQSIHMASNLQFPEPNCPSHRATMQTQRQARNPTPLTVTKGSPLSAALLPAFPVNYCTTDGCKTAHISSFTAATTPALSQVLIAKSQKKLQVVAFEDGSLWDVRAHKRQPLGPN